MSPAQQGKPCLYYLRGLRKSFDGQGVLHGIDLDLYRGETLGIIGPSGAGKTVLLKCMIALLPIDAGELYFDGKSVPDMDSDEQLALRRRVGLLFQAGALFNSITVQQNLEYGLRERFFRTMGKKQIEDRVAWALQAVGLPLSEVATMPADLSGGMQKRVGIARTLITHPEVVLYDDPTQGLDPPNAHLISDLIAELRQTLGVTSIVVSHDLRTVFTVCNRIAFLQDGRVMETGTPEELARSNNVMVRDFVLGHPPEEPFDPLQAQAPEPWKKD